jgi:dipeptidyl aminopeptidase/acylaminoacyl peptidase
MPEKRLITAEDLYRFQLISTPRISPDGSRVVFSQQRVEQKTEKKYTNLWMTPTAEGAPGQFTYGDQSDSQPCWSPDGTQIAFLSNRGDKEKPAQIYLISTTGGEAYPLTRIEGTIGSLSWSPDGKTLLCTVQKTDADVLEREKDEQLKKLGVVDRHYDRLFYKLDGTGYLPKERWHIWLVDTATGSARQLTEHAIFDESSPAWSPDGKGIVFISNRAADPDLRPDAIDLFVIPAEGGEIRQVPAPFGVKDQPAYSPDGKWIAYYAIEGEGLDYKNTSLWVVPADGSAPARNLTEKYDMHVSAWTINDMGGAELMPPTWSNDSQTIFFQVVWHGSSILMKTSLDDNQPQTVIGEGGVVGSFSLDAAQAKLAYFYGNIADPGQVMLLDLKVDQARELTEVNRDLLAEIKLGQVTEKWIQGPAGNDLQGWVLTPPDFDPARKYPSILEIHGGPRLQYGFFFMHEFYYLAAQGFVVHFCNPRGGRGYGEAHTKAIWRDWGGADYADLMAWTDCIAQEPYIDPLRMGVTGGSYGGYMTVWIIGHTQRFKAAVAARCVSNFVSMWGSSDFNWTFQMEINDRPPFEDLENFWKHSPIAYIGNAKTPTKVLHNEFDLRCPIEQGEQVYVALKKLGVDTEMVRFPDEFHGLSRNGRTDRRISRLNHIRTWFEKYLK